MTFKGIDAHQHFWKYDPVKFGWVNDSMSILRNDYLPEDLEPVLKANGMEGCVAIQADQSEHETEFLLQLAKNHSFIKGVVGWIDLKAKTVDERLDHYADFKLLKGFRHILQAEKPEFMLYPDFKRGIAALRKHQFTYDLLLYPYHLEAAIELVKEFPDQPFVVDHIAKPDIKNGNMKDWKKNIQSIAELPNVFCKISGMVTEHDFAQWKKEDFTPYLNVVVEAFGINKVMFGSDWPVCLVAASYKSTLEIVKEYFSSFSQTEQEMFFNKNATQFYKL